MNVFEVMIHLIVEVMMARIVPRPPENEPSP